MVIVFVQSIGASLLFNFSGYITEFQNQTMLMSLSCLFGGIVIVVLLLRVIRERTYNTMIGTITILVALGCVNIPYMMIDYNSDITSILLSNIANCFSEYKLQYQLTSGVVSLMIFVYCINYLYNDIKHYGTSVLFGIKTVIIVLAFNGFFSGLYHGTDITVQGLESEIVSYDTASHYMYCSYPDWDYLWTSSSCGGWINGNWLVKYLDKPLEKGGFSKL